MSSHVSFSLQFPLVWHVSHAAISLIHINFYWNIFKRSFTNISSNFQLSFQTHSQFLTITYVHSMCMCVCIFIMITQFFLSILQWSFVEVNKIITTYWLVKYLVNWLIFLNKSSYWPITSLKVKIFPLRLLMRLKTMIRCCQAMLWCTMNKTLQKWESNKTPETWPGFGCKLQIILCISYLQIVFLYFLLNLVTYLERFV